jgi:acyl carrier protein
MEIKNKVKEVLKRILEINEVDGTISQKNCEKWDSLRHLNLVVEIESEFLVDLEPEEIAEMKSFTEIIKILSSKNIV